MTSFASSNGPVQRSAHEARRSLQEPVLSPADDELDMDTPAHDTGASYTGAEGSTIEGHGGPSGAWTRAQAQLRRYVSEQPAKAALMALGAGALAALLLGSRMRGRRRRD